jgi:hypothetical protein
MSQVNITLNTNTVDINTTNNQIIVNDPSNNIVNVVQPVTTVVEVITSGPQGPPGTSSIADTGSFVTTSSFNAFTSSYNTGSFTGSFTGSLFGTSSWAQNSSTASYAPNYVPYTGATQEVDLGNNPIKTTNVRFVDQDYYNTINLNEGSLVIASEDINSGNSNLIQINVDSTYSRRYIQAPGFIGDYVEAPSITGSLFGTSSFAQTASYAPNYIEKSVGPTYTTNAILTVTQAEYDAIDPKDSTTLYFII